MTTVRHGVGPPNRSSLKGAEMFETILHTVSHDWLGLSVPAVPSVAFGLAAMCWSWS
jgi:hypothetical protein